MMYNNIYLSLYKRDVMATNISLIHESVLSLYEMMYNNNICLCHYIRLYNDTNIS